MNEPILLALIGLLGALGAAYLASAFTRQRLRTRHRQRFSNRRQKAYKELWLLLAHRALPIPEEADLLKLQDRMTHLIASEEPFIDRSDAMAAEECISEIIAARSLTDALKADLERPPREAHIPATWTFPSEDAPHPGPFRSLLERVSRIAESLTIRLTSSLARSMADNLTIPKAALAVIVMPSMAWAFRQSIRIDAHLRKAARLRRRLARKYRAVTEDSG